MKIHLLSPRQFFNVRKRLIRFLHDHGDHRITKDAIHWIKQATADTLETDGTLVLCTAEDKKVVGLVIVSQYGLDESFISVHKEYRNRKVAQHMVRYTLHQLGKLYGRIATDNIPSLKVCLDNDMVAFDLFKGPTGKPTLWLGGGEWSRSDIMSH